MPTTEVGPTSLDHLLGAGEQGLCKAERFRGLEIDHELTRTIPFVSVTDPVGAGIIETLAHPGGNTTGITLGGESEFYGICAPSATAI